LQVGAWTGADFGLRLFLFVLCKQMDGAWGGGTDSVLFLQLQIIRN
jgi:hypothetical protein